MEILRQSNGHKSEVKAVLFDFDGTISTLRHGWEQIMEPMMLEFITDGREADEDIISEVRRYIDQSAGIQTIYQMEWLAETVRRYGINKTASDDPWWYKHEYNRRLMTFVNRRKASIINGDKKPEDFLISGVLRFLDALTYSRIDIYVASGTDCPDVIEESSLLGLSGYFKEIAGASPDSYGCSKEAVLWKLIKERGLKGNELAVIGDGRVEIALGKDMGAIALGVASDEQNRRGINEIKRQRLLKAGADAITGDYNDTDRILDWLGITVPVSGKV